MPVDLRLRRNLHSDLLGRGVRPDGRQLGQLLAAKGIDLTRRIQKTVMTTCRVQVYLDGIRSALDPRSAVGDYEAVEYYSGPATVPAQYGANAACGVLLLWTRQR